MNEQYVCDLCGSYEIKVMDDSLGMCMDCGAYIDLDDFDDSVVALEKMTHKSDKDEHFLNKEMFDMLKGFR